MKRIIMLALAALLVLGSLCACSDNKNTDPTKAGEGKKLSVVTTIFPEYDWVKEVIKGKEDKIDLTFLMSKGTDLHSYQPSVEDITKISTCDLFVYVGGESDEWVHDVLEQAKNKNMKVINLVGTLGDKAKTEEVVEGMEHDHDHEDGDEHDHDHDHEDGDEHDHDHEDEEEEIDEHVWLSLRNAQIFVKAIGDAMEKLDPENAEVYKTNTNAYVDKLAALDGEYKAAVSAGTKKTMLFGDRFPFRYMVDDYELAYYAAFVGCSAETEASFETIAFLAGKVDELGLHTVFTIEGKGHKIAETVVKTAKNSDDIKIVSLNSMQGTTAKEAQNGTTYYSIMQSNLEVLREALK
ncbi:MAG: zinc ABC transporter substrate-binding protein [Lachnospiraceae bacterium]|nr:zinc ABC transporter substrate-binding protein [Lachnospiraceae bacterium]